MKYILPFALLLAGCTQNETPDIKLDVSDQSLYKMTRQEVISAISECESANHRAVVIHSRVKINGRYSPIVVDVTCAPSSQKQVLFSPCPNCPLTIRKIQ